jgi:hypothetical protein
MLRSSTLASHRRRANGTGGQGLRTCLSSWIPGGRPGVMASFWHALGCSSRAQEHESDESTARRVFYLVGRLARGAERARRKSKETELNHKRDPLSFRVEAKTRRFTKSRSRTRTVERLACRRPACRRAGVQEAGPLHHPPKCFVWRLVVWRLASFLGHRPSTSSHTSLPFTTYPKASHQNHRRGRRKQGLHR